MGHNGETGSAEPHVIFITQILDSNNRMLKTLETMKIYEFGSRSTLRSSNFKEVSIVYEDRLLNSDPSTGRFSRKRVQKIHDNIENGKHEKLLSESFLKCSNIR